MAFKTVRIGRPGNRLIYINGGYETPAGNSSDEAGFTVATGGNVFETLTGDRLIDNRKTIRLRPGDPDTVSIDLDAVDPPEPI